MNPHLLCLRTLGAIVAIAIWAPLACQRHDPNEPQLRPLEAPTQATTDDPGYMLQSHRPGAPLGQDCHQDQECQQPLRCLRFTCTVPPAIDGIVAEDTPQVRFFHDGQPVANFYLEVAHTPFTTQRGLMFRTRMADDWGMLFIFPNQERRSFWMRNTFIPLDMIFIDQDGRIDSIVENAKPLEERQRYESKGPARFVIELKSGTSRRVGLKPGQLALFHQVDDLPSHLRIAP